MDIKNKHLILFCILTILSINVIMATQYKTDFDTDIKPNGKIDVLKCDGFFEELFCSIGLSKGEIVSKYTLTSYKDSIINAEATGTVTLYEEAKIFSGIEFKDFRGNLKNLRGVKFYLLETETYTEQIPIYDYVCEDVYSVYAQGIINNCYTKLIRYETETKNRNVWVEYDKGKKQSGFYTWKIEAQKDYPNQPIDFILIEGSGNNKLSEWAWWSSSWNKKILINLNASGTFDLKNVKYSISLNTADLISKGFLESDCDDLRFVNSSENGELNFMFGNKTDSTFGCNTQTTMIYLEPVSSTSNTSVYAYFSNPSASDGQSKLRDINLRAFYTFDDTSGVDLSNWNYTATITGDVYNKSLGKYGHAGATTKTKIINSSVSNSNTARFTTIAWLKTAGAIANYQIVFRWGVQDEASNTKTDMAFNTGTTTFYCDSFNGDIDVSYTFTPNVWYMATCVFNSSHYLTYINGTYIGADARAGVNIGASLFSLNHPTYEFRGDVDNIMFFNTTLTSDEIFSIYQNTYKNYSIETGGFNPTVNANLPTDGYYTTNTDILFNCSASSTNPDLYNLTLFIDGIEVETKVNTTMIYNLSIQRTETLTEASHTYYCRAYNTFGLTTSSTKTFYIDLTSPIITLSSPTGEYNKVNSSDRLYLNWSVTDNLGLSQCWYQYNNTNTTVSCNTNTTLFNIKPNSKNIIFWSNDSANNINSNSTTWDYKIFVNSEYYKDTAVEGSIEYFELNITTNDYITNPLLIYDNIAYASSVIQLGYNYILYKYLTIPGTSINGTQKRFNWNVTLSGDTINLTSHNQTITKFSLDNCSINTVRLFNITLYDEDNRTLIDPSENPKIEYSFYVYSADKSILLENYSTYVESNNFSICINKSVQNDSFLYIYGSLKYDSLDHVPEYYYLRYFNLTNATSTNTTLINLYDLSSSSSTSFSVTVYGSDSKPLENALIYLQRQYLSINDFLTVEIPLTDSNGQTILHMVRNEQVYNILVMKDNQLITALTNIRAYCNDYTIGDCKININSNLQLDEIYDYDNESGILFSTPSYNKTSGILTFNYVSTDNLQKVVLLNVSRNDIFGNRSVCLQTITAISGTLTCDISSISDSLLKIEVYVDSNLVLTQYLTLNSDGLGKFGYLFFFIFALSVMLMFNESKVGLLIGIGISFIGAIGLSILNSSLIGIGSSGIWLIVILVLFFYRLNKRRSE